MGDTTKIEWADHTLNPWIGCDKIAPECKHCYAAVYGERFGVEWGKAAPRRRTSDANWRKALTWDRAAAKAGVRRRVFCASLADVFDAAVDPQWRSDLFDLIERTNWLDWLLLTKRPENIPAMLRPSLRMDPRIWLGTSVGHPDSVWRAQTLASIPAHVRFLSCEPLLRRIDLPPSVLNAVHWIIAGGESQAGARPMHPAWARELRDQATASGIAFLFKQWGEWLPKSQGATFDPGAAWGVVEADGSFHGSSTPWNGHDDDGPDAGASVIRVGKPAAGRLLDGRIWDEVPR